MKTHHSFPFARPGLLLIVALGCLAPPARAQDATGSIRGHVANDATGEYLVGASVKLTELSWSTLTDSSGTYEFDKVPAGRHTLQVFYTGLDTAVREITVSAGGETSPDFLLQAEIYKLEKYVVTGDREGDALSITRQRNADNIKSVLAIDAFGSVANEDPSDLLIRLAGITPQVGDAGDTFAVQIRGVDAQLNSVTVDGNRMSSSAQMSRDFRFGAITAISFDELEVIKSPTPDLDADSIGGIINMKTKSALTMRERRRVTYGAGIQWLHDFWGNQPPLAQGHAMHLNGSFTWQGLFDVFGRKKNLALTLSGYYSDWATASLRTDRIYQATMEVPAYIYDYRVVDSYGLTKRSNVSLRIDYKLGRHTTLGISGILAYSTGKDGKSYQAHAYLNGGNLNSTYVLPGYTNDWVEVSGATYGARYEIQSGAGNWWIEKGRHPQIEFVHKKGSMTIDATGAYSETRVERTSPDGGTVLSRMSQTGWTLDSSRSKRFPTLTLHPPSGRSIQNLDDYNFTQITKQDEQRLNKISSFSVNAEYKGRLGYMPVILKAGARHRRQESARTNDGRRWTYNGSDLSDLQDYAAALSPLYGIITPFVDVKAASRELAQNPDNWREDHEFHERYAREHNRNLREDVRAAYMMGRIRVGRLGFLGGVRFEDTRATAFGYMRNKIISGIDIYDQVAQQNRFEAEFGPPVTVESKYSNLFPSAHITYSLTKNILFRGSYSTGIGRPPPNNLVPSTEVATDYINIGNPNLRPQHSKSYDLSFEWYFEPVGQFTAGVFQKNLGDFMYTDSTGIAGQGEYEYMDDTLDGREIRIPKNGGRARIRGMELSWRQQFTFLPKAFKGLSAYANYTRLQTEGDYYGDGQVVKNRLLRFIPESLNVGFTYKYRNFWSRLSCTYTGEYLAGYSSDPAQMRWATNRKLVNMSVSYILGKHATLYCDMSNLLNEPQESYRAYPDRLWVYIDNAPKLAIGVRGRF
jgi:TonB-dependent receptor